MRTISWKPVLTLLLVAIVAIGCKLPDASSNDDLSFFDGQSKEEPFAQIEAAVTTRPEDRPRLGLTGPLRAHELSRVAVKNVEQGDKKEGLDHLKEAMVYDPHNEPIAAAASVLEDSIKQDARRVAQQSEAELRERSERAEALLVEAIALSGQGQWFEAYQKIHLASQEAPWHEAVRAKEREMRHPAALALMKRAAGMAESRRFMAAYATLRVAYQIDPDTPGLGERYRQTSVRVAAILRNAGKRAEAQSQVALAALRYRQAARFDQALEGLTDDVERAAEAEAQALRYRVVTGGPRFPAGAGGQARAIRKAYREALVNMNEIPNVELLSPKQLREVRGKGDKVPYGRLSGTLTSFNASDTDTVNYVSREVTNYITEVRYIDVNTPEALLPWNPETYNFGYAYYNGILRTLERRRLDDDPTNDVLPIFVRVPQVTTESYPVHTRRLSVQAVFEVALTDGRSDTMLGGETVMGLSNAADTYADADPALGIQADPLNLPPVSKVKQQAAVDLAERMTQAIYRAVASHGTRFLAKADAAQRTGKTELALEYRLRYARAMESAGMPITAAVEKAIREATGYSFADKRSDPSQMLSVDPQ